MTSLPSDDGLDFVIQTSLVVAFMKCCFRFVLFTFLSLSPYSLVFGQQTSDAHAFPPSEVSTSRFAGMDDWLRTGFVLQGSPGSRGEFQYRINAGQPLSLVQGGKVGFFQEKSRFPLLDEASPYKTNFRKGVPIVGVGAFLVGASILARVNEAPLTLEQVNQLNRDNVWRIDRNATYQYSTTAGKLSDVFAFGSIAVPWLYLIPKHTRRDFSRIVILQFETGLMAYGTVSLTKSLARRVRPFAYNANAPLSDKLTINARESFFSGHTSTAAAMSFFTATTFSQYYPDSRLKPLVWTYAVIWPAATGYLRYRSGSHFLSDVVVGYVVGATAGILIPKIHQKIRHPKKAALPVN